MNKILLTGDIHGDLTRILNIKDEGMTKEDIVIVLGDFGIIFFNDEDYITKALNLIGQKNFTTAFVDGNHENFNLIEKFEEIVSWNEGQIGLLPGGVIHLLRGEVYNFNGKRVGVCGGANSIDKWHRTENISWWKQEEITDGEINKLLIKTGENKHLDIMLSHDCPSVLVPLISLYSGVNGAKKSKSQRQLQIINETIQIDKWYFGHWHIDKKIDDKYECLFKSVKEV